MIDPGTVVGPNYRSTRVCIECLKGLDAGLTCDKCKYPLCDETCMTGERHKEECSLLAKNTNHANQITKSGKSQGYAPVTILRVLLLSETFSDSWKRTDELMDHLLEKSVHPQEWNWYEKNIVEYIRDDLGLTHRFSVKDIERAIGLLNVNAVCLQFSKARGIPSREVGKGLYPIFAIMSHECVCNARYLIDPATFKMYVRARLFIKAGDELTVQYLSALWGTLKRRKKIKEEWYFDCTCKRCSDPTECGTYISAVKCFDCDNGVLLPEDPLNYDSPWLCNKCSLQIVSSRVETLVEDIEAEFSEILDTQEYWRYTDSLTRYSGTILHPSHWILTTARRNLIQYLCYSHSKDVLNLLNIHERYRLCEEFFNVLKKVDPGWSELSMFILREYHFAKLNILESNFASGIINVAEFSVKSRNSIEALNKVKQQSEYLKFDIVNFQ